MKIELKRITVKDLVEGYTDDGINGVFGYDGKLDIRPPYQREFIYKPTQRDAVIDTVAKGFPLNVMYWAVREDGTYEVIDGQQRTISICQYFEGDFSVKVVGSNTVLAFHNLPSDKQQQFLDYTLTVYFCSGTHSEKLDWFRTINIAGEELADQELRNAVYSGAWVSDAKRYFSKGGNSASNPAYGLAGDYMDGDANRQKYLETVIRWINDGNVEAYMSDHQNDQDAKPLWEYFRDVIQWVKTTFPTYRSPMKGLPWGSLYNVHKDDKLSPVALEARVSDLFGDYEVVSKKGIYPYLLTGDEKHLNLRRFDERTKLSAYEKQKGICPLCKEHFEYAEMDGDHITPWSKGGKTEPDNCQMLCRSDNIKKSNAQASATKAST